MDLRLGTSAILPIPNNSYLRLGWSVWKLIHYCLILWIEADKRLAAHSRINSRSPWNPHLKVITVSTLTVPGNRESTESGYTTLLSKSGIFSDNRLGEWLALTKSTPWRHAWGWYEGRIETLYWFKVQRCCLWDENPSFTLVLFFSLHYISSVH